jgi:hypothetical protein
MKKILSVLVATGLVLASFSSYAEAAPEVKKVCHDVKKGAKTVQQCKNVKIHKKFEGTAVPEKAPAKKKK